MAWWLWRLHSEKEAEAYATSSFEHRLGQDCILLWKYLRVSLMVNKSLVFALGKEKEP